MFYLTSLRGSFSAEAIPRAIRETAHLHYNTPAPQSGAALGARSAAHVSQKYARSDVM